MREMELVTLACGLGNFPYIAFPPVAFPDPDYCSSNPVIDLEPELPPDRPEEPPEPPVEPPPVVVRREPVLARTLSLAAPVEIVEPVEVVAESEPIDRAAPSSDRVAQVNEPVPDPAVPPYPLLKELHSAVGRPSRRSPPRDPRGAPKPAARVALAKAQQK